MAPPGNTKAPGPNTDRGLRRSMKTCRSGRSSTSINVAASRTRVTGKSTWAGCVSIPSPSGPRLRCRAVDPRRALPSVERVLGEARRTSDLPRVLVAQCARDAVAATWRQLDEPDAATATRPDVLLLTRHGQSLLNAAGTVNGDPGLDRGLSDRGRDEASVLAAQIAGVRIDACVTSAFPRAQETARIALGSERSCSLEVDPELGDVRIGELEGRTLEDYRVWKHTHPDRGEPFPGGESLDEAARRYAGAFERLLERADETVLCVCHEIPVRYAVNASAGSDDLDRPVHDIANAVPYVFDADGLGRAIARIRELAG